MIIDLIKKIKFENSGILVIDNFFNQKYCSVLREFALNPNGGYNYQYPEYSSVDFFQNIAGIDSDILLNSVKNKIKFLGEEIKYQRSWCFCYKNKSNGVPAHADPSFINVNVWLTPNESVNDFSKNGLKIYYKKRKEEDDHDLYNKSRSYVENEIKNCKYVVIPYNYNRAVVFYGSMYHETYGVDMKEGTTNRRISYTFLFDK